MTQGEPQANQSTAGFVSNSLLRSEVPGYDGTIGSRSDSNMTGSLQEKWRAALNYEQGFPQNHIGTVNKFYDDALALARAGLKAAKKQEDEPFARYFHEYDSRWVVQVFQAFVDAATKRASISKLATAWIRDGTNFAKCHPPAPHTRYMFIQGPEEYYGPYETWITICPITWSVFNNFLTDHNCDYVKRNWPRTNYGMRVGGFAFLHEWLHFDYLTRDANNHLRIEDQKLLGPPPDGGRIGYGPYLSMQYKDYPHTHVAPNDNDDNFMWMAMEAYWMQKCRGYNPQPAIDEPQRPPS